MVVVVVVAAAAAHGKLVQERHQNLLVSNHELLSSLVQFTSQPLSVSSLFVLFPLLTLLLLPTPPTPETCWPGELQTK